MRTIASTALGFAQLGYVITIAFMSAYGCARLLTDAGLEVTIANIASAAVFVIVAVAVERPFRVRKRGSNNPNRNRGES